MTSSAADFTEILNGKTSDLDVFLQDHQDRWTKHRAYKLKEARWTKDSYYRYHLLRLVIAKDEAVEAAFQTVRGDWAAFVTQKETESVDF